MITGNVDAAVATVMDAYNYVFGYVTVYYDSFFKNQDRELPWAMVARILAEGDHGYYANLGIEHLSKVSKETYERFMEKHKDGFEAWKDFRYSMR